MTDAQRARVLACSDVATLEGWITRAVTLPTTEEVLREHPDVVNDVWAKGAVQNRIGSVEELVGACVFLASDASSFVNGHVLYVDGGITASL